MPKTTIHNITSRTKILGVEFDVRQPWKSTAKIRSPRYVGTRDQCFQQLAKNSIYKNAYVQGHPITYQWFYGGLPIYRIVDPRQISLTPHQRGIITRPDRLHQTLLTEILRIVGQKGILVEVEGKPKTVGREKVKRKKITVTVSLDEDLVQAIDMLPGSRSSNINKILRLSAASRVGCT